MVNQAEICVCAGHGPNELVVEKWGLLVVFLIVKLDNFPFFIVAPLTCHCEREKKKLCSMWCVA